MQKLFHIGPQKSATTWFYKNLSQHPQIATSPKDSIHYYDIHYALGKDWYQSHFTLNDQHKITFDPTYSYIRSPYAPQRIYQDAPDAQFILALRDPVERAYSHYWHEYKKDKIAFAFHEVLENYDLFQNWIEPGVPVAQLKAYLAYFPGAQFFFLDYERVAREPLALYSEICGFLGLDADYVPDGLEKSYNVAAPRIASHKNRMLRRLNLHKSMPAVYRRLGGIQKYQRGVDPDTREAILQRIRILIDELESLVERDLGHWK